MTFYRVELTLSKVDEYLDSNNYTRQQNTTIAKLDLTADSPRTAMAQALPHVQQLTAWHQDKPPTLCPGCTSGHRQLPLGGCTDEWHQTEVNT